MKQTFVSSVKKTKVSVTSYNITEPEPKPTWDFIENVIQVDHTMTHDMVIYDYHIDKIHNHISFIVL